MDDVKSKIEKLLAMANGGGNENEAEIALRMAKKLMVQHGIEMAELRDRGQAPEYDWRRVNVPAGVPQPVESMPLWFSTLSLAIARFTDCHVVGRYVDGYGACAAFGGDYSDVQYAVWIAKHLRDTIRAESAAFRGTRRDKDDFRKAMANRLIERMRALGAEAASELRAATTASGSALVVTQSKIAARDAVFGAQRSRTRSVRGAGAYGGAAGRAAGDRVGFGRPVGQDRRALGHG